jgi:hypothetical protein
MMKTVIGLFSKREDIERASQQLSDAGLENEGKIQTLTSETAIRELLGGHQSQVLANYTGWGLFSGLLLFGLYNVLVLVCNCALSILNFWVELDVLFLSVGGTILLAGVIAYFLQVERLNSSFRPYVFNVKAGGFVAAIDTQPEQQQAVIDILHRHNGAAIRVLETRFSHYWRHKTPPIVNRL